MGDAVATAKLYQRLAEEFYEKETAEGRRSLFVPKALSYHVKRDTPITVSQKEQLYKLKDRHKLIIDYDIDRLSRGEASRQIDLLLAEYGR